MAEPQVLYEADGKVGIVTLNRPNKLNALSMELRLEMERVLRAADDKPETSVIVLRSEGRSFCVGFDVGADGYDPGKVPWRYDALKLHQRLGISVRTLMTPWMLRKPVIASVQGHCLGGVWNFRSCDRGGRPYHDHLQPHAYRRIAACRGRYVLRRRIRPHS